MIQQQTQETRRVQLALWPGGLAPSLRHLGESSFLSLLLKCPGGPAVKTLCFQCQKHWLSFIELDKAVVHVIRLASFL